MNRGTQLTGAANGQASAHILKQATERIEEQGRKAASSKYDYVKIKVWLGQEGAMEHYYILSRFLISRMLTVTKVPQDKAVKIALEVKKWLVDNDKLDITQDELEAVLFSSMRARGFGDDHVHRFRMMNQFQQQKRPLVILICGSACTGKSTLAQQLASRLNLPSVLPTDALYRLLEGGEGSPLPQEQLWRRRHGPGGLVSDFQQECKVLRRALDGDLEKCILDGKSIIIEGLHLDPGLYLKEFGPGGMLERREGAARSQEAGVAAAYTVERRGSDGNAAEQAPRLTDSISRTAWEPQDQHPIEGNSPMKESGFASTRKCIDEGLLSHGRPVFVPIVLCLAPTDYPVIAEEWLREQAPIRAAGGDSGERERVLAQLLELQDYLCDYGKAGVQVVEVGVLRFQQTLDQLHDHVLQSIERAMNKPPAS